MTKLLRILLVFIFLHTLPIAGQTIDVPDVDSLGDIWVVTIDNTFSMKSRHGRPIDMVETGKGVQSRLANSNSFKSANWEKDRFLFLKSGLREGRRAKFIDTEFIRHTDEQLYKFDNQDHFAQWIGAMITNSDYSNYMSFVSQMRLLSLCKALDYIAENQLQKDYRGIRILTISDDAVDQHDQWSTDYRTLKECAPEKVNYLSGLARKYIYNPLNGWGGGDMILEWSDESRLPHIWMYQYVTAEGRRGMDTVNEYVSVKARDGNKLRFQVGNADLKPCLCKIDSVCVNDDLIIIGKYLTDTLSFEAKYDNGLLSNNVTVYGKAQFDYNDSILGEHYRMIDFVQQNTVMPQHVSTTLNVLVLLLVLVAIIGLLYLLWFLPRKVLFDIYDASGCRYRVRRGYRWQWSGNIIPLLLVLFSNRNSYMKTLVLQSGKVEIKKVFENQSDDESKRVLIVSRYPVMLSVDCTNHNSGKEDLENYYKTQDDYPSLLKNCYRTSAESIYYNMQHSRYGVVRLGGILLLKMHLLLCGAKNYYHYNNEDSVSIESSALTGKLFLLEKGKISQTYNNKNYQEKLEEKGECNIRKHLLDYYTTTENAEIAKDSDVILILSQSNGRRVWDVVLTTQARKGQLSLRNIRWVYHYALSGVSDWKAIKLEYKALMRYLRQNYHRRVAFLNHLNLAAEESLAMVYFDIEQSYSKRFLSLVSTEVDSVTTLVYDPFRDGQNNSIQFLIKSDNENLRSINHLYCCFLPQPLLPMKNDSKYREKLSDDLISFYGKNQAATLEIEDEQNYRIHGEKITVKNNNQ